jgi:hypothetical protein
MQEDIISLAKNQNRIEIDLELKNIWDHSFYKNKREDFYFNNYFKMTDRINRFRSLVEVDPSILDDTGVDLESFKKYSDENVLKAMAVIENKRTNSIKDVVEQQSAQTKLARENAQKNRNEKFGL